NERCNESGHPDCRSLCVMIYFPVGILVNLLAIKSSLTLELAGQGAIASLALSDQMVELFAR
ncbi:MAG: hypothetical protein ACK5E4_14445, partial [Planctomycetia bacterium]